MKILFLMLCLIYASNIIAQSDAKDIMLDVKHAKNDTIKLKYYLEIACAFVNSNNDSIYCYLKKAEKLSKKFPESEYVAKLWILYGYYWSESGDYIKAATYNKQALILSNALQNKELVFEAILNVAQNDFYIGNHFVALRDLLSLEQNFGTITNYKPIFYLRFYALLSAINSALNRKEIAFKNHKKMLKYCTEKSDYAYYYRLFYLLVSNTKDEDLFIKAIEVYPKAMLLAKAINNKPLMAEFMSFFSLFNTNLKYYRKSVKSANELLEFAKQHHLSFHQNLAYQNLGENYNGLGKYLKALMYNKKALMYFKSLGYKELTLVSLEDINQAYVGLGDYKNAYESQAEARKLNEELKGAEIQRIIAELEMRDKLNEKTESNSSSEIRKQSPRDAY